MQWNTLGGKKEIKNRNKKNKKKRWLGKARPSFKKHLRLAFLSTKPRVVTVLELWEAGDCCWTFCFCALKKVAPGALAVVSCQLLTSKNVHSHSSEALIPFRKTEPQSSNTFMWQCHEHISQQPELQISCSLAHNFPSSTGIQPHNRPVIQASLVQDSEMWSSWYC